MNLTKPVTIEYRDGKHKIIAIQADSCSGEIPAGSRTFYCIFYLNKVRIARVAKSCLLPGYEEVYQKLYGRPWLLKVLNADKIVLSEYHNWDGMIGGYPHDTESIWRVNYANDVWVMVAGSDKKPRAILHVANNEEVTRYGKTEQEAIKKLFPGKRVVLLQPTITAVEL